MNRETCAIYSAGLIQGITLVAFPAASTIITDPHDYGFSSTAYGSLFIPQAVLSILASAMNPRLSRRLGSHRVFLFGLIANLIAMLLLVLSTFWMPHFTLAYSTLFLATAFLGLGFGLVVPTINEALALLFPAKVNFMLLILNALLGVGTTLAPVLIILFIKLGFWWGLPLAMICLLVPLLLYSMPLSFPSPKAEGAVSTIQHVEIPGKFWFFAAFALLYGIVETLNGNWVSIYMRNQIGATIKMQSLGLTAFWGMVTFGRIFFAVIDKFFQEKNAFQMAPFIAAIAFIVIASLPSGSDYWAVSAFGLMGFGCSILLPLIISFGTIQLKAIAPSVPGMIISYYLLGYGIAAFGVGPLEEFVQMTLRGVFLMGAVVALILGILSIVIIHDKGGKHGYES